MKRTEVQNIKKTYEKYRKGDSLTDKEIKEMIKHTKGLSESLIVFGDTARLVSYEIRKVHDDMVSFDRARNTR